MSGRAEARAVREGVSRGRGQVEHMAATPDTQTHTALKWLKPPTLAADK